MAHQVESMFSVKETPWHGLGKVLTEAPDSPAQAIVDAGLDWTVEEEIPQCPSDGASLADFGKVFRRSDNKKVLGIVGPNTHPLQNKFAFDFFAPFMAAKEASFETAGSLAEGRKVWVLAKINRPNIVVGKDDEIVKFVLLSNSHDGTTAVRVGFTPIRVVCANTLALAHKDKASELIRVRHTKEVEFNLEKIRDIINIADQQFEATAEQYRLLANKNVNFSDLKRYVKLVFDFEEDDSKISTRSKNIIGEICDIHESHTGMAREMVQLALTHEKENQKCTIEEVTKNFESGLGSNILSTRGSLWTLYNAVNEYINYRKGHNNDTRMNSLWFGQNQALNSKALKVALEMLAV